MLGAKGGGSQTSIPSLPCEKILKGQYSPSPNPTFSGVGTTSDANVAGPLRQNVVQTPFAGSWLFLPIGVGDRFGIQSQPHHDRDGNSSTRSGKPGGIPTVVAPGPLAGEGGGDGAGGAEQVGEQRLLCICVKTGGQTGPGDDCSDREPDQANGGLGNGEGGPPREIFKKRGVQSGGMFDGGLAWLTPVRHHMGGGILSWGVR